MNVNHTLKWSGITVVVAVVASIIKHGGVTLWTAWYPILAVIAFLAMTAILHWRASTETSNHE